MVEINMHNLTDTILRRLNLRTAAHTRPLEADGQAILGAAAAEDDFLSSWLAIAEKHRGTDLTLPSRSTTRSLDLS